MTAPQIPNLLETLRKSKGESGRGGLRGGGRKGPSIGSSSDAVIRQTDDDAAGSRASAVNVGYLRDPYARALSFSTTAPRRMPIINRGTYVRTIAIDALVKDFMDAFDGQPVQIISLGAGTDTRPFRMLDRRVNSAQLLYHEIDFPECTRKKITAIKNANLLPGADLSITENEIRLLSPAYCIHPVDLRELAKSSTPENKQHENLSNLLPQVDPSRPTLLLSECCLTYLSNQDAKSILHLFLTNIIPEAKDTSVSIALYEPLQPDDAFGETMTSNLAARGISLPGLSACPNLDAHKQRLREIGFTSSGAMLVKDWWKWNVKQDEKDRLRSLEGLDEEEEWDLLAAHYGFIWSSRGVINWPTVM